MATPQEIQRLLQQLQQAYNRLGTTNPFANFDISNIVDAEATAQQLEVTLQGVKSLLQNIDTELDGIVGAFQATLGEISKSNKALSLTTSTFRGLNNLASKLRNDKEGLIKLDEKQLVNLIQQTKLKQRELLDNQQILQQRKDELIQQNILSQISLEQKRKNREEIKKINNAQSTINNELLDQQSNTNELIRLSEERLKTEQKTNKLLGISGQLLSGFEKTLNKIGLGGLSNIFGLDEVNKKMRETAERITALGDRVPEQKGKFMVLKSGFKELGTQFKESLNDPATRFTLAGMAAKSAWSSLTFIFNQLKTAAFQVDSELVQFQKSLMLSREEAIGLRKELSSAVSDSVIPTKDLAKALGEINSLLEIQGEINADNLLIQSKLTRLVGLEGAEAAKLQFFSEALGTNFEGQYKSQLGITQQVSKQFGVQVNQKSVLSDVGKSSAYTLVQFKGSVTALTQAVAESKALGLSLETTSKIAQSILSFESSITAELEAEALLGKDINLDRARYYALTNDISGLMGEINSQIGTFSDFQDLTILQQQAYAKALGMGVGEMSEMLLKQEYLDKNGKIIKETTDEELQKRLESLSAQESFNLAMEKLQSIVGDLMAGPMGNLLEGVSKLAQNATLIKTIFGVIAAFSFAKTIGSLVMMGVQLAIASGFAISTASALTLGIGTIAIAAGIAALMAYAVSGVNDAKAQAGDLFSPSKGKTTISTKEGGLFELSDNDDVIAAPGLASYMDSKNNTITPSTGLASTRPLSSSPTISDSKIDNLIKVIENMNKRPIEVVSTITMDGRVIAEQIGRNNNDTLGQSLNVGAYNI